MSGIADGEMAGVSQMLKPGDNSMSRKYHGIFTIAYGFHPARPVLSDYGVPIRVSTASLRLAAEVSIDRTR